jgi:hypothetical protein
MENQRVRTIDVDKLSSEQVQAIEKKLVEKINPIVAKAIEDANKFLNPYGLKALMSFEVTQK